MWTPYKKIRNREHEFVVEYSLIPHECGGRKLTYQGYRCDFMYGDAKPQDCIYMIHPEFLDKNGEIELDENKPVLLEGKAFMWILCQEAKDFHKEKLKIGDKAYMMEGSRIVGELSIISFNW